MSSNRDPITFNQANDLFGGEDPVSGARAMAGGSAHAVSQSRADNRR
jgi:hypothetical protein